MTENMGKGESFSWLKVQNATTPQDYITLNFINPPKSYIGKKFSIQMTIRDYPYSEFNTESFSKTVDVEVSIVESEQEF